MAVKPKKKVSAKSIDQKYYGDEPIIPGEVSQDHIIRAFNWYNYMYDTSKAKTWLLEYLKRNNRSPQLIKEIRSAPDWRTATTAGWMARMIMNGSIFPSDMMNRFEERIRANALYGIKTSEPSETVTNVISIQDRTKRVIERLICDVEELIDSNPEFSMYEFLVSKQATAQAANAIKAYYVPCFNEVTSGDEQVKEAYGKTLKFWQKVYGGIVADCERFVGNKKAVKIRKPREKKVKAAVDQVKNIKYQKEFPPLKIVSVNPAEIVGAQQLWTYNTKTKKLARYDAVGPAGIQVKGTTLTGFDVEVSSSKNLRKPDISIPALLGAGKVALRKFMDELKTVESKPNGRINLDTILLRVVK